MIYIYNNFNMSAYWSMPFIVISQCLIHIFKKQNIECKITNNINVIGKNDLVILFSGPTQGYSGVPELLNKKIVYINSEPVHQRNFIINDCNNERTIQVWDYSFKNINNLRNAIQNPDKIKFVPITYHRYFEVIYSAHKDMNVITKDIDFCLFGGLAERRVHILNKLTKLGYNVCVCKTCNLYELVNMLQRSKIIIIVHFYADNLVIDFYRLFLLLSNKLFVIHESPSYDQLDPAFNRIIYSEYKSFVDDCVKYINWTQDERDKLSEQIYDWWKTNHPIQKYMPDMIKII